MAKKGMLESNLKKKKMEARLRAKRDQLRSIVRAARQDDCSYSPEEVMDAMLKLDKMPKNSARVRIRNRCEGGVYHGCGRPRGVTRMGKDKNGHDMAICRVHLREFGAGGIMHLKKASL